MPRKKTGKKSIFEEAKELRKKYPRRFATWGEYVAQASAIYSSKHHGHSPVGHKHKKKSMPRTKKHSMGRGRPGVGTGSGISTNSKRHTDYNRNKVNITVGAVQKHKREARRKLLQLIQHKAGQHFTAVKKSVKKKIAKQMNKLKAEYRRLSA